MAAGSAMPACVAQCRIMSADIQLRHSRANVFPGSTIQSTAWHADCHSKVHQSIRPVAIPPRAPSREGCPTIFLSRCRFCVRTINQSTSMIPDPKGGFMAPPSFTATFKPSPDQAEPYPFLLTTEEGDGLPVNNLIQVEDGATEISIAITLAGDASFPTTGSPPPIVWTLAPDEHSPYVLSGNNNNILKFTVPAPSHVLHPWVFRFIVNISGVTGIRSQNIYIAKLLAAGPEIFLKYAADKGDFS